ncbi:hypothetical protein [Amycolatopsis sp.]|uniref:hypothetical protein n=1 Tax=Amycolatopsis sp. TaxID=37632 RepID=UPI002CCE7122|nr:hypothetical protein [Amycolatopsis sp.]HVV11350.1 hypothetical protein [Amycolatopsis sp.]
MKRLSTGEAEWDLVFDEKGGIPDQDRANFLDEVAAEAPSDLFLFSHGWGTAQNDARSLYDSMFPMIRDAGTSLGKLGFAGIYWPSLWFPPTPAIAPPQAGSTQADAGAVVDLNAGTAAVSGAEIAKSLAPGFPDEAQRKALTELGGLIDDAEKPSVAPQSEQSKEQTLAHIHELLQSLVPPPRDEPEDSGELSLLLTDDPKTAYGAVAEAFGSAPPGSSAQGIGDWFGRAVAGAKDAVRVLSYNIMKTRAGDIGRSGLGPLLRQLHTRAPDVRVHLLGHSFGARLVSFALAGIDSPGNSPVHSLLLLQGAFSHWAFSPAQGNPFGRPGALNGMGDRVHGPLLATYSEFDWAVGVWYPRASFLTGEGLQAKEADRWGGMGSDGYQDVDPSAEARIPAGLPPRFEPGTFYRVHAGDVINNVRGSSFSGAHSDIRKPEIAELAVLAARTA